MIAVLALQAALAGPSSLSLDLDGDGKPETVRYDAAAGKVHIGSHVVDCEGDPCDLEAHDVSEGTKGKEVEVCAHGPRDDQACTLYTLEKGALRRYTWPRPYPPSQLRTAGNGIVLAVEPYHLRLFERIEKYTVNGFELVEVPQPIYTAVPPAKLPVDRTFPLLYAPGDKRVIANTKPGTDILILGEHGEKPGWLLVRLSSGISGWVERDTLERVSTQYMQIMGAG
ncbi:MAG: hypothetical protein KC656_17175 [Myxococcales bacterium]|nr:hypothetical protein [Myxococcales bacterium]MCB9671824.1 hypothetical protein [Alphaproteobacteria bacterium]